MKNYFVIFSNERGFFKDFVNVTFAASEIEAQIFKTKTEAETMKKALEEIDKIKGLEVVSIDKDLPELVALARYTVKQAEIHAARNPKPNELKIVVVEPQKKPYKKIIQNELEDMQELVGGFIESVTIGKTKNGSNVALTINEQGKFQDLPLNRRILGFDFLVGTFFISAYNLEGDAVSLTDREADYFIKKFTPVEVYI